MPDIRQDINNIYSFGKSVALIEHLIEGIICEDNGTLLPQMRWETNSNVFFCINLLKTEELHQGKFSIKTPSKCKTFVNGLTEIFLQWSKWLYPWSLNFSDS